MLAPAQQPPHPAHSLLKVSATTGPPRRSAGSLGHPGGRGGLRCQTPRGLCPVIPCKCMPVSLDRGLAAVPPGVWYLSCQESQCDCLNSGGAWEAHRPQGCCVFFVCLSHMHRGGKKCVCLPELAHIIRILISNYFPQIRRAP